MMDRQRHTRDIAHPKYEIIDNAFSAAEGYNIVVYVNRNTYHKEQIKLLMLDEMRSNLIQKVH